MSTQTGTTTTRAAVSERYGSIELTDLPRPTLEEGTVILRVRASSVNPSNWYRVEGPLFSRLFGDGVRRPKQAQFATDVAGVVEEVAADVDELQPGDEVFGTCLGGWAGYARARVIRLTTKPPNVSFEEAAAVPVAGLTALQALRDHGDVRPGQKVLINGASGGVGTYAVQLAKFFGAEVTAVCSPRNVEQSAELGADRVCDYTREDFTRIPDKFDLVLDIAGSKSFGQLQRVLTPDATVVVIGAKMKRSLLGPLPQIGRMWLGARIRRRRLRFFVAKIEKADLELMRDLLATGSVRSVIDRTFELDRIREALDYLGDGHARGKIAITVPGAAGVLPAGPGGARGDDRSVFDRPTHAPLTRRTEPS